jgi:hypothetical protein
MVPEPDDGDDDPWTLFNSMNGNDAVMSAEAAGIAVCLLTYSHHACRTMCSAMTGHYDRLRDYAQSTPKPAPFSPLLTEKKWNTLHCPGLMPCGTR